MYDLYFTVRLLEELRLAERAKDSLERLVHLQACHYYESLLSIAEFRREAPDVTTGRDITDASRAKPY